MSAVGYPMVFIWMLVKVSHGNSLIRLTRLQVILTIHQYLKDSGYDINDGQNSLPIAAEEIAFYGSIEELEKEIGKLKIEMDTAAKELAFEEAAVLRDRIKALRKLEIEIG